jgi:hypothetical protein
VFAGYTFLYLSNTMRAGDLIDRNVNLTQTPTPTGASNLIGPARPAFPNKDSDFWAQGVNFGLQFSY